MLGFTGIGVSQSLKEGRVFIHLDLEESYKRPNLWSY